jgi:hypothetical protein
MLGHARADGQLADRRECRVGNPQTQTLSQALGATMAGRWGEDDEFLAAPAEQRVRGAQRRMRDKRQLAQYGIAGLMSVEIVDALEMIDVEQDQRDGLPVATASVEF